MALVMERAVARAEAGMRAGGGPVGTRRTIARALARRGERVWASIGDVSMLRAV
jgi:hypothetical protein